MDAQEEAPGNLQVSASITGSAATVPPEAAPPSPWGIWATAGWSALVALGFVTAGIVAGLGYVVIAALLNQTVPNENLASNGLFVSLTTCVTTPVTVGLCVLFAWLRRGITVRDYLALRTVPVMTFIRWSVALLIVLVAFDLGTTRLQRPIVPEIMIQTYRTAAFIPLLWVALIVGAPLAEEVFFRGFLFKGIQHSWLGPTGAVLLTSASWAAVHMQYDWFDIGSIFVLGLLLGFVRVRTGSIFPGMAMHALTNLVATVQVALLAG